MTTTISFHLVLSTAALTQLAKSIPIHFLILSSHLLFCLSFPFFLSLCSVELSLLSQKILRCCHTSQFLFLDQSQEFVIFSSGCLDLSTNNLIGDMAIALVVQQLSAASHFKGLCPLALPSRSMTHRQNMATTRDCISFPLFHKNMLLSLHIAFSFVSAAVAFAILERTSGFQHSFERILSRYLKFVTFPNICPLTLISL